MVSYVLTKHVNVKELLDYDLKNDDDTQMSLFHLFLKP